MQTVFLAVALGIIVVARAALRSTLMRRLEARFHRLAVDRLLQGNLLSASAMRDDGVEAPVLEGVASGTRLLGAIVPEAAADALATVMIVAMLSTVEPPRLLLIGSIAVLFSGVAVLLASRVARREEERSWNAYRPILDGLVATIGARLEIVANGASDSFRGQRRREIEGWQKATHRSGILISLAGRFPVGVAVLVVGAVVLFERSWQQELSYLRTLPCLAPHFQRSRASGATCSR